MFSIYIITGESSFGIDSPRVVGPLISRALEPSELSRFWFLDRSRRQWQELQGLQPISLYHRLSSPNNSRPLHKTVQQHRQQCFVSSPPRQIALPLGLSSCYKSVVATRAPIIDQNTVRQPNTTLVRAKTKATGYTRPTTTATKQQLTITAVVPFEETLTEEGTNASMT